MSLIGFLIIAIIVCDALVKIGLIILVGLIAYNYLEDALQNYRNKGKIDSTEEPKGDQQ